MIARSANAPPNPASAAAPASPDVDGPAPASHPSPHPPASLARAFAAAFLCSLGDADSFSKYETTKRETSAASSAADSSHGTWRCVGLWGTWFFPEISRRAARFEARRAFGGGGAHARRGREGSGGPDALPAHPVERRADPAEDEGVLDGAAPDHHAVAARLCEEEARPSRRRDVAVADLRAARCAGRAGRRLSAGHDFHCASPRG